MCVSFLGASRWALRRLGRLSSVAVLFFLAAGGVQAASIGNVSLGRLDWYDAQDVLVAEHSSWGTMAMDVFADPAEVCYLNVVADVPGNAEPPAWVVQNLPIFPLTISDQTHLTVDFNVQDLGVAEGTPLGSNIDVLYALDSTAQSAQPTTGTTLNEPVATIERRPSGVGDEPFVGDGPGEPAGHKAQGEAKEIIQHVGVPAVQEGRNMCQTGSYARSIAWLNKCYKLDSELKPDEKKTAKKIYNDLAGLKIGQPFGTEERRAIPKKASYLSGLGAKKGRKAVTKLYDVGNALPNLIHQGKVPKDQKVRDIRLELTRQGKPLPDLAEWLFQEMKTEDVELGFEWHQVTLTAIYKQGGQVHVRYRDDLPHQGDPNKGDKGEKDAILYLYNKNYYFGYKARSGWVSCKVRFAVSESIEGEKPKGMTKKTLTSLPPRGGEYGGFGSDVPAYETPWGEIRLASIRQFDFRNATSTEAGQDMIETFDSTLEALLVGPFGEAPVTLDGTAEVRIVDKVGETTGYFGTEMTAMQLTGQVDLPDIGPTDLALRESLTEPSQGNVGVHDMFDGNYFIDGFFDLYTELSFDGGAMFYPALDSTHLTLVPEPSALCTALCAVATLVVLGLRRRARVQRAARKHLRPVLGASYPESVSWDCVL